VNLLTYLHTERPLMLYVKQKSCEYQLFQSFDLTWPGNWTQVLRLRSGALITDTTNGSANSPSYDDVEDISADSKVCLLLDDPSCCDSEYFVLSLTKLRQRPLL